MFQLLQAQVARAGPRVHFEVARPVSRVAVEVLRSGPGEGQVSGIGAGMFGFFGIAPALFEVWFIGFVQGVLVTPGLELDSFGVVSQMTRRNKNSGILPAARFGLIRVL